MKVLLFSVAALLYLRCIGALRPEESALLREDVREAFHFTYDSYMRHAFPLDELRPISCSGMDTLGEYALTLVDALDMLALVGNASEFSQSVQWLAKNLDFDKDLTVSLFETNIRVMGGLLSAHLLASDESTGMRVPDYRGELLDIAHDLGQRMLPAFNTPTGIPYGAVNLKHGVAAFESRITCTAAGGTLAIEFGTLSRLTGNPIFEAKAKAALIGLWSRRSELDLVGAHINIITGEWTHRDAGIGTSIDSFYEYLMKAYILLGDDEYLDIFREAYQAAEMHLRRDPWYVEVNMNTGSVVWPVFNSLQAFWPGLQVLAGDVEAAARTHRAFFSVWQHYGFTPEGFHLNRGAVHDGQVSYPLRPELIESTYMLYKATRDPIYLAVGREMLTSLQRARAPCGYARVADVRTHQLSDHMESFFLAETLKVRPTELLPGRDPP
ncbi:alpha-mannosidase, partial [Cymbomonas tetramitiformis]